ncbi:hypothetical protein [Rummeliibacillus pycnus]|uniref:hypothetical protein n=1 Tax=Rummeliibacillus pycnus TaxID=101070 RepID=UPI0037C8159B
MSYLLTITIILVVVILIVPTLLVLTFAKKYMRGNQKFSKIFILIYSCVLLLSPIVYFLLPNKQDLKVLSKAEQQTEVQKHETFAKDLIQGKLAKYSKYHLEDWLFEVKGDKLGLKLLDENGPYPYVRVVVEWIQSDSQQVSAYLYRAPFIQYGLDLTNKIQQPTVTWKSNHSLFIQNPKPIKLNNKIITDKIVAFPFGQSLFENENLDYSSEWEAEHEIDLNTSYFLYLKVPKHMDIIDENNMRIYD